MAPTSEKTMPYSRAIAEIYNQHQIGKVYDLYQHNAVLHLPWGDLYGREAIIREYTWLLAAFPELSYRSLNTVCEEENDQQSKLMEHYEWSGKHTGFGFLGPPTSKAVTISGLRVLRCRDGRILEEWVQDDRLNLIRQLEIDPLMAIEKMKTSSPVDFTWEVTPGGIEHSFGQTTPDPWPQWKESEINSELVVETYISKVWNWRLLKSVNDLFASDCQFDLSGGVSCETIDDYKATILNRLAAFSDLTMLSDDFYWKQTSDGVIDSALRWTMIGTHDGFSSFGAPSRARICVPGLSLIQIENNRIVNLVERFGELALMANMADIQSHQADPYMMDDTDNKGGKLPNE
ncbi:MAG: ester cyclase [Desulfobacterales bacterium]|nr:ester cyclase [Desulfobacterales bacterium]